MALGVPGGLPWRPLLGGLAVVGALLGAGYWAARPGADANPSETLAPAPFVVAIACVGDLIPADRHMVAPPFTGKVDSLAEEGKDVKAGDIVARLDTQDAEESLQDEVLRQSGLVKDEQARALKFERDRKGMLTDRQAAADNLALTKLQYHQLAVGYPKAQLIALDIHARSAARSYATAEVSYHLQAGLLTRGIIRPIDLDQAKVTLEEAKKERDVSATALVIARRGYPPEQVEAARLAVLKAQNSLREVNGKLKSLEKTTVLDAQVVAAERAWSAKRLALYQRRVSLAALRAPAAGVVVLNAMWGNGTRKKVQVGDDARQGEDFMEIADVRQVFVKIDIKESDIGRVHVGMPAKIQLQSLHKTFDAKLVHLGVLAVDKPDTINREGAPRVFEGLIATTERSPAFRPGMTVDTQLIVEQLPHALSVPNGALSAQNGETVVWVAHPGAAPTRRVVVTGEHTEARTVITQGLAAGEAVLANGAP